MIRLLESANASLPSWITSQGSRLFRSLNSHNLDIHNMTYHKAEIPASKSEIPKDPSIIPIFKLSDDSVIKVYIPNIYEDTYLYTYGKDIAKCSWKQILAITEEYGYLDTNEEGTLKDPIVMRTRGLNKQYSDDRDKYKQYYNDYRSQWTTYTARDKSGYKTKGVKDLYKRLFNLGNGSTKDVAIVYDKWINALNDLKNAISRMFDQPNYVLSDPDYYDLLDTAMRSYSSCLRDNDMLMKRMKSLCEYTYRLENSTDDGTKLSLRSRINSISDFIISELSDNYRTIRSRISSIDKFLSNK